MRFFEAETVGREKRVHLSDITYALVELPEADNFDREVESRWNLVETAWGLGVPSYLVQVGYNDETELFEVNDRFKRKDITPARNALNGYQKGQCFYCYEIISLDSDDENLCDVDHFFPHRLKPDFADRPAVNLDGVWNLVLSCKECNRGKDGKFDYLPDLKYLERLRKRNDYLISSHHPLRETIIRQAGETPAIRHKFLQEIDSRAKRSLIHRWSTEAVVSPRF